MKEILLTSSVLILALLLLRLLFRKTISRQVQYALWGLVALRLLVPVSLPAMEHNVLTAAESGRRPVRRNWNSWGCWRRTAARSAPPTSSPGRIWTLSCWRTPV